MAETCPVCNGEIPEGERTCPTCGYKSVGATESFEPVKMGETELAPEPAREPAQSFELRVVRGPQTGMSIALHEGTLSLGRDPRCDVFLNDMTVSRNHAQIELGPKGCVLRDNSSFNGIWVNDRAVDTCLLKSGDLIQVGAFCLQYRERA